MEIVSESVTHHRTRVPTFSSIGRERNNDGDHSKEGRNSDVNNSRRGTATLTIIKEGGDSDAEVSETQVMGLR